MADVESWLVQHELGHLAPEFKNNDIDFRILFDLSENDLRELGLSFGDRKRLVRAIASDREAYANGDLFLDPTASSNRNAERRNLVVVFVDMVGSTALSTRFDPEDLRGFLTDYQNAVLQAIHLYDGHVARFLGDGVLCLFGWPRAHENDAERAVRAGLDTIKAMSALQLKSGDELHIRIGIASGLVVVSDLTGRGSEGQDEIVGETPNLASRLQELAQPDQIVVSEAVRLAVRRIFEFDDLGTAELKGFEEPLRVYSVRGERDIETRYELRTLSNITPMVGRDGELAILQERWQRAMAGEGQCMLLAGEAGIGKSRLLEALIASLDSEQYIRMRYQCEPHAEASPLYPVVRQIRRAAGISPQDKAPLRKNKLRSLLRGDDARVVADLVDSMPDPSFADGDSMQQRLRTLKALVEEMVLVSLDRPVLMILEDAHWIDPTTAELLEMIIGRIADLRVLLVVTGRPGSVPDLVAHPTVQELNLSRLSVADVRTMIRHRLRNKDVSAELVRAIESRSDGVPLFVEEMAAAILETADIEETEHTISLRSPLEGVGIPDSLQGSFLARIDRLNLAKEAVQIASCIGREFELALLSKLMQTSEHALTGTLSQLIDAGVVFRRVHNQGETYVFKHALLCDAAYSSLLRAKRRNIHLGIAEVFASGADDVRSAPERLAHHYSAAQSYREASIHWLKAGEQAVLRSAYVEASNHFSKGLRDLRAMENSSANTALHSDLAMGLGQSLMATRGLAADETLNAYRAAQDITQRAGSSEAHISALNGLLYVHYGRAELADAEAVAQRSVAEAQSSGRNLGAAITARGQVRAACGRFKDAIEDFEEAQAIFEREPENTQLLGPLASYRALSYALAAGAYHAIGEAKLGIAATAHSVEIAKSSGHTVTMAMALVTELLTPLPGGLNPDPGRADFAIDYCSQYGLANYAAWARLAKGAVLVRRENIGAGIETIQEAIEALDSMKSKIMRPAQLGALAGAYARSGNLRQALDLIQKAVTIAESTGERQALAALYRGWGQMLGAIGKADECRRLMEKGLSVAREQQACSELARIEKSLSSLG